LPNFRRFFLEERGHIVRFQELKSAGIFFRPHHPGCGVDGFIHDAEIQLEYMVRDEEIFSSQANAFLADIDTRQEKGIISGFGGISIAGTFKFMNPNHSIEFSSCGQTLFDAQESSVSTECIIQIK
jgi:hypothetical protein